MIPAAVADIASSLAKAAGRDHWADEDMRLAWAVFEEMRKRGWQILLERELA